MIKKTRCFHHDRTERWAEHRHRDRKSKERMDSVYLNRRMWRDMSGTYPKYSLQLWTTNNYNVVFLWWGLKKNKSNRTCGQISNVMLFTETCLYCDTICVPVCVCVLLFIMLISDGQVRFLCDYM